jgi:hypothetical protein
VRVPAWLIPTGGLVGTLAARPGLPAFAPGIKLGAAKCPRHGNGMPMTFDPSPPSNELRSEIAYPLFQSLSKYGTRPGVVANPVAPKVLTFLLVMSCVGKIQCFAAVTFSCSICRAIASIET